MNKRMRKKKMDGGVGRGERVAKKSKQTWKNIRKQKGYTDIYQMIFVIW